MLQTPGLFDENTQVQVLNLAEALVPAMQNRFDLVLRLAGALDSPSYDLKNSVACVAKRFPLFAEKAEIQLSDAHVAELLDYLAVCGPRGQVLLLVILKRCDFNCNSRNIIAGVRDACEGIARAYANRSSKIEGY